MTSQKHLLILRHFQKENGQAIKKPLLFKYFLTLELDKFTDFPTYPIQWGNVRI